MHRTRALALGLIPLFLATPQSLSAQQQSRFTIRQPEKLTSEVALNMRVMTPANVSFSNLGNVDAFYRAFLAEQDREGRNAPDYLDASFAFDSSFIDADGNFLIPTDADGNELPEDQWSTFFFAFEDIGQLFTLDSSGNMVQAAPAPAPGSSSGPDNLYIRGTVLRAQGDPFAIEDSSGIGVGWEIQYNRYLNEKRRLGLVAAFGVNGIHTEQASTWTVSATGDYYFHRVSGEALGVDGYEGVYNVPVITFPSSGQLTANPYPDASVDLPGYHDVDLGEVDATGAWELDTAFYTFRLGGVYNLDLTRTFDMRFSGGVHALIVSSRFTWDETFTVAPFEDQYVRDFGEDRETRIIFGIWADAGATWRINNHSTFFGSVEYQKSDTFDQTTSDDVTVEFDSSSLIYAKTGFSWAF